MLGTTFMALVLTALYLYMQNLWAVMAIHTLIDLRVLTLLWLGRDRPVSALSVPTG